MGGIESFPSCIMVFFIEKKYGEGIDAKTKTLIVTETESRTTNCL